jgi:hypothetical protein
MGLHVTNMVRAPMGNVSVDLNDGRRLLLTAGEIYLYNGDELVIQYVIQYDRKTGKITKLEPGYSVRMLIERVEAAIAAGRSQDDEIRVEIDKLNKELPKLKRIAREERS